LEGDGIGDKEVWSENIKPMLDDMHLRKIDLADEIFVINPGRQYHIKAM
jgi:hypothetical protein